MFFRACRPRDANKTLLGSLVNTDATASNYCTVIDAGKYMDNAGISGWKYPLDSNFQTLPKTETRFYGTIALLDRDPPFFSNYLDLVRAVRWQAAMSPARLAVLSSAGLSRDVDHVT